MSTYSYYWGAAINANPKILSDGLTLDGRISSGDKVAIANLEQAWIATLPSWMWNNLDNFNVRDDWNNWLALPVGTRLILYNLAATALSNRQPRQSVTLTLPNILTNALFDGYGGDSQFPAILWFYTKYTAGNWSYLLDQHPQFVKDGEALNAKLTSGGAGLRGSKLAQFQQLETDWLHRLYGDHYGDPAWVPILTDQNDWNAKVDPGVRLLFYLQAAASGKRDSGAANKGQIAGWLPMIFSRFATSDLPSDRALFWQGLDQMVAFGQPLMASLVVAQQGGGTAPTTGTVVNPSPSGSTSSSGAGIGLLLLGALVLMGGKK